eukprot:745070-Rhodomonas_salina.2
MVGHVLTGAQGRAFRIRASEAGTGVGENFPVPAVRAEHLPPVQGVELEWCVRAVKPNILGPAPLVRCSISELVASLEEDGQDVPVAFGFHVRPRGEVSSGPPADYLNESEAVCKDCKGLIGVSPHNGLCNRRHFSADNHRFSLDLEGEVELALGTVRPCTDEEGFTSRFGREQLSASVSPDFLVGETLEFLPGYPGYPGARAPYAASSTSTRVTVVSLRVIAPSGLVSPTVAAEPENSYPVPVSEEFLCVANPGTVPGTREYPGTRVSGIPRKNCRVHEYEYYYDYQLGVGSTVSWWYTDGFPVPGYCGWCNATSQGFKFNLKLHVQVGVVGGKPLRPGRESRKVPVDWESASASALG